MKKSILIFDDDQAILQSMKYLLEDEGYTIDTAEMDTEFMGKIKNRPDIVIIDYYLQQGESAQWIGKMKSDPETRKTPVILMSSNADLESKAIQLGASGFLSKPFELENLLSAIRAVSV